MTPHSGKTPWLTVFILVGAGIISAFQVGKVPPLLPDIQSELGITLVHAGWVLSIFNIIGLVLGACTGSIADTLGHRRLLIAGLCLQAAGSLAGSISASFGLLILSRFLEGMGFLSVIVSTPSLIVQAVNEKDLKVALSVWTCYLPAGACLIMMTIPLLVQVADWRGIWQINGCLIIGYVLLISTATRHFPAFEKNRRLTAGSIFSDMAQTALSAGPLLLSLIFFTYALQWLAVMGFLPTLLQEKYAFSKSAASVLTGIMVGCNIVGNLSGGWLLKKGINRWALIITACLTMGCGDVAIYWSTAGFTVNYAGCLLFSMIGGLIPASVLGAAPLFAPRKALISTTVGLMIQGGQAGQVAGPTLLALLVSATGTWTAGAGFLAAVAAMGTIFSLMIPWFTRKK